MVAYTYSRVAALNFNTTPPGVAKSATGSVYAIADTTFTTPLNMTMVVGGAVVTSISSDAQGFFPDFTVNDRTSVVWKQASSSFTTVLTTSDPVPGPQGAAGTPGATGVKGDRGDLATWQTATFYPLNMVIANPSGDLVKVITAHTSGASYDATKFDYSNSIAIDSVTAGKVNDAASATRVALDGKYGQASSTPAWKPSTVYAAGTQVVSPSGALVKANVGFTSGTSYNAADWTTVATAALMPRYYDDGNNYADRGALQILARQVPAPQSLQHNIFSIVSGLGDNTTFRGVSGGMFQARDLATVATGTKGVLYGSQHVVAPAIDRDNVPYDDVVGISIENQGTAKGTDALYFGHTRADKGTNPLTGEPRRSF